jgi:HlyD family secretion protein
MSSTQLTVAPSSGAAIAGADDLLEYQAASAALVHAPVSPLARRVGLVVSALVVACFVIIAAFPLNRIVTAPGRIVAVSPTSVLQPLETSIVRSVDVRAGQAVTKGQLLATLDPTFAGSDAAQYQAQVQSYGAEAARLRAELDGRPYEPAASDPDTRQQKLLYEQRKAALTAQLSEYQQKIASLQQTAQRADSDLVGYKARLVIASDVARMREELESLKAGSRLNTLAAQDTRTELVRQVAYAEAQAQSARADLASMIHERDYQLQNWRAETSASLTDAERKLSDAREYLRKAALRKDLVEMRAPADGIVQWIAKVSIGSVMQPGDQLLTLVPDNTRLEVEAKIPGDEIGFVSPGQQVSIKLDTLYTQIYGYAEGKVETVSPDSFLAAETGTTTAAQRAVNGLPSSLTGAPPNQNDMLVAPGYYLARISIDAPKFRNLPAGFRLMPGMSLAADIEVGHRTLLAYLLGRVAPVLTEGFREP